MADKDDILYRPDIPKPVREQEFLDSEARLNTAEEMDRLREALADILNVPEGDIPVDPFTAMKARFVDLENLGLELKDRTTYLMEKTIDDLDGYVGEAPPHIKRYIEDLVGVELPEDITDPLCTLGCCEKQCIFRSAGAFSPYGLEEKYKEAVDEFDADKLKKFITEDLTNAAYISNVIFGLKLLAIVLRMSFVIAVHYTVGYLCGWFRGKLSIGWNFYIGKPIKKSFGFHWSLGDWIADIFGGAESNLLQFVGYHCGYQGQEAVDCSFPTGESLDFKSVNCCTTAPVFFGVGASGEPKFTMSRCFEHWLKQEMDPNYSGSRTICSWAGCQNETIDPSSEEREKARQVAEYLLNNGSKSGVMNSSDLYPLQRGLAGCDSSIEMARQSQSALDSSRSYFYTGEKTAAWDCFGMVLPAIQQPGEAQLAARLNDAAGSWMTAGAGTPLVEQGVFLFEYLKVVDEATCAALQLADKVVINVANLARWGSSRELCCWVYLAIVISSMISNVIEKGTLCPSMEVADALRNQFRWATNFQNTGAVNKFVQILQILKLIVDMFRRKMERQVFLAGLKLPLKEMWEMIKLAIANGISQFLDILFGPIDMVLSGLKLMPDVRMLIKNECFGIDKFFDFLQCLLGNVKFGILNYIMQFLDFSLNDMVLIQDIYLSRTRLAFLDSLSKLLGSMIKLILGLQDCYEPGQLPSQILDQQIYNQYESLQIFRDEVARGQEDVRKFDDYSVSLMNQEFIPSEDEIEMIDNLQGGLSRTFGEFGGTPEAIIRYSMQRTGQEPEVTEIEEGTARRRVVFDFGEGKSGTLLSSYSSMELSRFLDDEGNLVTIGEFKNRLEEITGRRHSDIVEAMEYIQNGVFDILRGENDGSIG